MQTPNVLERPEYPSLPQGENGSVRSISRDKQVDAAWLAGVLDGEGYTGFLRNGPRGSAQVRLMIINTSPQMIQKVSLILSEWGITYHYLFERGEKSKKTDRMWKDRLRIVVSGSRGVRQILETLLPHLTAKRAEAECLLTYLRWRLDDAPLHNGPGQRRYEIVVRRRDETIRKLSELRNRLTSLQRLPRRASVPLDLSELGVDT